MTAETKDLELSRKEIRRLRSELKARIAEAAWLKAHYSSHLEQAMDAIRRLPAAPATTAPLPPAIEESQERVPAVDADHLLALEAEVERLQAAERRYLDRIEELKDALAARPTSKDPSQ